MTNKIHLLACLSILHLCNVAAAGTLHSTSPSTTVKTSRHDEPMLGTPSAREAVVSIDVTGILSCDAELDPSNTILTVDLFDLLGITNPSPNSSVLLTGVGWDLTQTSGLDSAGGSWLSEMTIGFDYEGDGSNELALTPSGTDDVGTAEPNSSGGIVNLVNSGFANGEIPTGILMLEFFESYDDENDVCDARYDSGMLMLDVVSVPEPSMGLLSLAILVCLCPRSRQV